MARVTSLVCPWIMRLGALKEAVPSDALSSQYWAAWQSSSVSWVAVTLQGCSATFGTSPTMSEAAALESAAVAAGFLHDTRPSKAADRMTAAASLRI